SFVRAATIAPFVASIAWFAASIASGVAGTGGCCSAARSAFAFARSAWAACTSTGSGGPRSFCTFMLAVSIASCAALRVDGVGGWVGGRGCGGGLLRRELGVGGAGARLVLERRLARDGMGRAGDPVEPLLCEVHRLCRRIDRRLSGRHRRPEEGRLVGDRLLPVGHRFLQVGLRGADVGRRGRLL